MRKKGFGKPRYIVYVLVAIFAAGAFSVLQSAYAQNRNAKKTQQKETYTRPEPHKPIKPTIPEANRYQDDKVFLEQSDSLYRPQNAYEEYQIVKGNVVFRQGGMWMFCDSAYYYPRKNSMNAFGHVEMRQGDTLFVYADKVYYDGMVKHAKLTRGPSRGNVVLKNRNVTLTTDSLDYDLVGQRGWYAVGGRLEDDVNTLTSEYGEYSPATKIAEFREDVLLVNRKDGYRMITEDLVYNTATHIADINSRTRIEGANDTIITTGGNYNTVTDHAVLTARSIITHRDSSMNVTTLEGDSIIYDKLTRTSRAFMFRDPRKSGAPMVINDTARKVILIGGYGEYNDELRRAYSTDYPLLIEYSRPDTLFLRADTILSFIESVVTDTVDTVPKDFHVARAIGRARFFNQEIQGIADTLLLKERDSILYMLRKPVVWAGERQVYGNRIDVHLNDSTADWAELPESGMLAEHIEEDFFNQLTGTYMKAYFNNRQLDRMEVKGNVVAVLMPQEKDSTYNKLVNAESSYLNIEMDGNKIKHLKMWPEVSGVVVPLFDVKPQHKIIEGFKWLEKLRPEREWYGDRVRWIDNLGDVPDELDEYFKAPPLFKPVPKSARDALLGKPSMPQSSVNAPAEPGTEPNNEPAAEPATEPNNEPGAEPNVESSVEPDVMLDSGPNSKTGAEPNSEIL